MKHPQRHVRHTARLRYTDYDTDPPAPSLHRSFVLAHAHAKGPLSTLTGDCRVRIEPSGCRVQVA